MELVEHEVQRDAFTTVTEFRSELYACLVSRSDALFELCDALLCTDGPVRSLVDLALAPEHRRGHGALYSGLNLGRIDVARLRRALAGVPLPRARDGRLVLALDVSPWLRPNGPRSALTVTLRVLALHQHTGPPREPSSGGQGTTCCPSCAVKRSIKAFERVVPSPVATASADMPASLSPPAASLVMRAVTHSSTPTARSAASGASTAVAVSCSAISTRRAASGSGRGAAL